MSIGRNLQVGDKAITDFNHSWHSDSKKFTVVTITDRKEVDRGCKSGVLYRVAPTLRNCEAAAWIDADWFEPYEQD